MNTVNIDIPSLPENIRIVESFIDNIKEKYSLNDDVYGNVMIAVTESVTNAIAHGNKGEKNKNVSLTMILEDTSIKFTVTDEGEGFDFNNLDDPTSPENIEKLGGRGIFLMKNLCDEVSFTEDGRSVAMTFYLS
ncbi:MAG: ATP-binding protein [Cytophagales bacterium]|nr:ATP-binding protein [Cytophagales bacterium]